MKSKVLNTGPNAQINIGLNTWSETWSNAWSCTLPNTAAAVFKFTDSIARNSFLVRTLL